MSPGPVLARAAWRAGASLPALYLRLLGSLLLGYALAGKGFAYLGVGSAYVGELVLALGAATVVACGVWRRLRPNLVVLLLIAFQLWGLTRTLPLLPTHGMLALRDAVLWGYAFFAIIAASVVVSRPWRLGWLLSVYGRFGYIFVLLAPALFAFSSSHASVLPRVPGSDIPIVMLKESDVLTQLAGVASFQLLGLGPAPLWSGVLLLASVAGLSVYSRGGMLAFLLSVGFLAVMRPLSRRLWVILLAAVLAVPLLLSIDTGLRVKGRSLSGPQILENLTSVFVHDGSLTLSGTTRWRLEWWAEIVDYTVLGPHFWTGKGFGPNLATEDGFDIDAERSLRSPHNATATVLARMGVPGLVLWVALHAAWLRALAVATHRAQRLGQRRWPRVFLFLVAGWIAHMVNGAFDVYLEGPMGAIWFWTLFGVGIAAVQVWKRQPEVLEPPAPDAPDPDPHPARRSVRGPRRSESVRAPRASSPSTCSVTSRATSPAVSFVRQRGSG